VHRSVGLLAGPAARVRREGARRRAKPSAAGEAERLRPEAVHELASRLAHQLGNLLQVVNGNLELVAQRISDEDMLRYLGNVRAATKQLDELARSLPTDPPE